MCGSEVGSAEMGGAEVGANRSIDVTREIGDCDSVLSHSSIGPQKKRLNLETSGIVLSFINFIFYNTAA